VKEDLEGLVLDGLVLDGAGALGVDLDPGRASRLADLVRRLLHWNRRINLVARTDAPTAIDRHVHDGLALLRLLDLPEVRDRAPAWADVGSGAGLPGLVLAIARPDLRIVLVEPVSKKAAFARDAARALAVANVEVIESRLEDLREPPAPAALSRAAFPPEDWARRGRALVGPEGLVLVQMARDVPEVVLREAWKVDRLTLPVSSAARVNALLGRARQTLPAPPPPR
jgi:16S rRNA (guanine527-N7)-methyltransferase